MNDLHSRKNTNDYRMSLVEFIKLLSNMTEPIQSHFKVYYKKNIF